MQAPTLFERLSAALTRRFYRLHSNPFIHAAPPGHYYSPIPDLDSVNENRAALFDQSVTEIPGISLHANQQLELAAAFSKHYDALPFQAQAVQGLRYQYDNNFFSYGDAISLYSMLRHVKPKKIIEVGSGFSSAVMLDTNEQFFDNGIEMTFVEPYPQRLHSLLNDTDRKRHHIIEDFVQNVPLAKFQELEAGDILFIDSSHVAKVGSDVVQLFSTVLPALNKGVLIHFHDIFWPFEYPEEWVVSGRAWNEIYMLSAFLQYNADFEMRWFNSYLATHHADAITKHLPDMMKCPGGGLWMEKVA